MAGYGRAPNVSQYINNLNSIAGAQDNTEGTNLEDDLAWVVNTELFDFDLGSNENQSAQGFGQRQKQATEGEVNGSNVNFEGNYNGYFEGQPLELNTNFPFDPQLVQQSPQSATFPAAQQQQQQQAAQATQQPQTPTSATTPGASNNAGIKRSHSVSSPGSVEDAARMAAEEDKRRRNTAASARFRVKKKQREAALEKTAKDMTDKVEQLQKRVSELEMENKWLRELVVEKGAGVKGEDGEASKDDDAATVERIPNQQGKKGVGTKSESS